MSRDRLFATAPNLSVIFHKPWRWISTVVLTVLWYVILFAVDGYARSHFDVFDPSEGSHMGSVAVNFKYGLMFALVSMVPPALIALRMAWEENVTTEMLACGGLIVTVSTVAFYATGAAGCDSLGQGPGQDAHFLVLAGVTFIAPALLGAIAIRRAYLAKVLVILGLFGGAVGAFMVFLQAGHCENMASKVLRESDALLWFTLAAPLALVGAALGCGVGLSGTVLGRTRAEGFSRGRS
ncbi:MAG: hypothetical protein QOG54_402 [Actinomycetota bacterium]|jgi:hypothetical protein|nr:hypothetical protein [Actinomycetota bacterium]